MTTRHNCFFNVITIHYDILYCNHENMSKVYERVDQTLETTTLTFNNIILS